MSDRLLYPRCNGKSTLEINRLLEDIKRELERKSKMTNYEKYKGWFDEHRVEFAVCGAKFGVNKNGNPMLCGDVRYCTECEFYYGDCIKNRIDWCKAEYKADVVDWSKVPVDTKIEVSMDREHWEKAHFAKYRDGKVFSWWGFRTSFTETELEGWNYGRLYKEPDKE